MLFSSLPCVLWCSFLFECFKTLKSVFGRYNLMEENSQLLTHENIVLHNFNLDTKTLFCLTITVQTTQTTVFLTTISMSNKTSLAVHGMLEYDTLTWVALCVLSYQQWQISQLDCDITAVKKYLHPYLSITTFFKWHGWREVNLQKERRHKSHILGAKPFHYNKTLLYWMHSMV